MRRRHAGSARASRRDSSAAAAYSHSSQVGSRAPSLSQKAFAANQLTFTAGLLAGTALDGCEGESQSDKYRATAQIRGTRSRSHWGFLSTKCWQSCTMTAAARI